MTDLLNKINLATTIDNIKSGLAEYYQTFQFNKLSSVQINDKIFFISVTYYENNISNNFIELRALSIPNQEEFINQCTNLIKNSSITIDQITFKINDILVTQINNELIIKINYIK